LKFFLIIPIKFYQTFFPKKFRGKCLYKESCSNFVLRKTIEEGLNKGIKSFIFRYKNCRPNYFLTSNGSKQILITCQNEIIEEIDIAERIIKTAPDKEPV
jgi:putative component of membrane protein insertase Oxa1/YidC/SpoIIIJ protein YidD